LHSPPWIELIYEWVFVILIAMKGKGVVKNSTEIIKEDVPNADKVKIQWLISDNDGSQGIYMRKFTMQPGADMKLHSHPNTEHLQYYLKGEVKLHMGDDEYEVGEGDSIFIPAGVRHKYKNIGEEEAVFLCIVPGGNSETVLQG